MNNLFKLSPSLTGHAKQLTKCFSSKATEVAASKPEVLCSTLRDNKWFRDEINKFRDNYPSYKKIVNEEVENLLDQLNASYYLTKEPIMLGDHVKHLINYNIYDNKMIRGSQILHMVDILSVDLALGKKATLLPELVRVLFNMQDDITDGSTIRYQKPCWHLLPQIGNIVPIDIILLKCFINGLIEKSFKHLPFYVPLLEYIEDMTLATAYGQYLDEAFAREAKRKTPINGSYVKWDLLTEENWYRLTLFKTLPVDGVPMRIAFYLAGITDEQVIKKSLEISNKFALLDQVSDDLLDSLFDPKTMETIEGQAVDGDDCLDIRDGKITYMVVKAREKAKGEDRKILEANYGRGDDESVQKIKELYNKLDILSDYSIFQKNICQEILDLIEQWDAKSTRVPKEIFPTLATNPFIGGGSNLSKT